MEQNTKKLYVVYTDTVYTKDGKNALEVYNNETDLYPVKAGEFDDPESAMECYNEQPTGVSYDPYHRKFEHKVKYVEIEIYDTLAEEPDDGFLYAYEWLCLDFPERSEEIEETEDD